MATREERKAAQAANLAATPLPKRIGFVLAGGLTAFIVGVATNALLSDGPRMGYSMVVAILIAAVLAYQYLVVPSRQ